MTDGKTSRLRIATRNSPLALWQANYVKGVLEEAHKDLRVAIVAMTTQGDKLLDTTLSRVGGKGLFVKELEVALLEMRADIAVHSMKDVPMELPPGLELPVICRRADPTDALVSSHYDRLESLPRGARVGTSSLRRQCQLRAAFPGLVIEDLRGNVNTRLAKLDAGHFDAIVLATAGLMRLDLAQRIRQKIEPSLMLPAAGQGALGIECRAGDDRVTALIAGLHHSPTAHCVGGERLVNRILQGGCQAPIACFGEIEKDRFHLRALVGSVDGGRLLADSVVGAVEDSASLAGELAERLLAQGAAEILQRAGIADE